MWSGVYQRSNFSSSLLHKVLKLVPLTKTVPEVYFSTITTFFFNSYDALGKTITHMKSLKLNIYPGDNVTNLCTAILVDADPLESDGDFNPEHLWYITHIFEDAYDSIFRL